MEKNDIRKSMLATLTEKERGIDPYKIQAVEKLPSGRIGIYVSGITIKGEMMFSPKSAFSLGRLLVNIARRVVDTETGRQHRCVACDLLAELYASTGKTDRQYYLMTELFVKLHDGDICNG